jgi:predicted PurR-regulated permease PerM
MKVNYFLAMLFMGSLYLIYTLYQPFWMSIMIAMLLAISTAHIQQYFERKTKSILIAASMSTILLALLFFAPLGYFLTTITLKLNTIDPIIFSKIYIQLQDFVQNLPEFIKPFKPQIEAAIQEFNTSELPSQAISIATTLGSYSASFLKTTFFIIIFYFFAQYNRKEFSNFFKKAIQLSQKESQTLGYELSSVMSVVFYSILTTAMFEGALFGVVIYYMGYNGLLFGIMYGFASLIPIIGGTMMWLPFMIYELSLGHTANALFIATYSIIVISVIADTFIKPIIIKKINTFLIDAKSKMNELLIFFSIIAGLTTFGFWGMILGPAITAFFLAVLLLIQDQSETKKLKI